MGQTKILRHECRSVRNGRGEGLGWCLIHGVTMRDLLQTVVDGSGPHERLGALVTLLRRIPRSLRRGASLTRMNSPIAAPNSGTRVKTPRRMCVGSPNHRATRFSHEALVGVPCRCKRGGLASHFVTVGWWGVPSLSRITWGACPGEVSWSMTCRNFSHSSWR